jgi:hypothetical protein
MRATHLLAEWTAAGLLVATLHAATGDNCTNPIVIHVPADLPWSVWGETTCGRGNDYSSGVTCIGDYDGSADIVYQLIVTAPSEIVVYFNPLGTGWTSIALDDSCPPGGPTCIANIQDESGNLRELSCLRLEPGTYTLMIDAGPMVDCIPYFDLAIETCVVPRGACCVDDQCFANSSPANCYAQSGTWYHDFDCTSFVCPVPLERLPDTCATAYVVPSGLYSTFIGNNIATADGPPGSCNMPDVPALRNDLWFRFTPPSEGILTLHVLYDYNGVTVVYTGGACNSLTEIACLNASSPPFDEDILTLSVSTDLTYWIQIGDYGMAPGGGATVLALYCASPHLLGDINCDGEVDFGDINPFVLILSNPEAWAAHYPACDASNGDINNNGTVGFDDINPFVRLLCSRHPGVCGRTAAPAAEAASTD